MLMMVKLSKKINILIQICNFHKTIITESTKILEIHRTGMPNFSVDYLAY